MTNEQIVLFLSKHSLFKNSHPSTLSDAVQRGEFEVVTFGKQQVIHSPDPSLSHRLGILLSGNALVYSADENRRVFLRTLGASDAFGVANLFSETPFVSRVVAKNRCSVLFIASDAMQRLIGSDRQIMQNYIRFLSDRIVFLNQKITYFTAGSAERRLALYLAANARDGVVTVDRGINHLAEMLDVSRATLYRAMETLMGDGLIQKDGKRLTVTDPQRLTNHYIQ